MDRQALTTELLHLATACHTGVATDDQRARLERLLEDDADARAIYLRIADDTVTLNDIHAARTVGAVHQTGGEEAAGPLSGPQHARMITLRRLAIAAAAGLLIVAGGLVIRRAADRLAPMQETVAAVDEVDGKPAKTSFARILSLANVDWAEDAPAYHEWDRISEGDALRFDAGCIEILYDNGVQFVIQGPADCVFTCEKKLTARAGKLVARVSPEAIGFKIVTPHTAVIDRGTSFGLTIDPDHQTDVVVYEGKVDLAIGEATSSAARSLEAGEALRIASDGSWGRIASVASDAFLPPPQPGDTTGNGVSQLIRSVSDNLKSSQTAKYYRVVAGGFREDCRAYVDRRHQWNGIDARGIPPFLQRADYVMTFNDDKVNVDLRIAVTLAQPVRLYILFDDRAEPPRWLSDLFTDTGWDVGVDEGYDDVPTVKTAVGAGKSIEQTVSVWVRDIRTPSTILLGALREEKTDAPPRDVENLMYGILATPLPAAPPIEEAALSRAAGP